MFEEGEKVGVKDIHSSCSFISINDAGDIDFTRS